MSDRVKVRLGALGERAHGYVEEGRYASISEVVQAGLCALEREERLLTAYHRARLAEALADEEPRIPLDEAIERVLALSIGGAES